MEGPEITFAEAVIDNGAYGKRTIRFETGRLAQQAAGAGDRGRAQCRADRGRGRRRRPLHHRRTSGQRGLHPDGRPLPASWRRPVTSWLITAVRPLGADPVEASVVPVPALSHGGPAA